MKNSARSLTLILLAALTAQTFACGSEPTGGETTPADTESTAPETEKPFADDLGEYDFGGADFTMLVREMRKDLIVPESETGDVVNDAIFARNSKLAERFNVKIKYVVLEDKSATWNQALESSVMSGDGDYDLVLPDYWWGCETRGLYLNLLDYDVLDFSEPYWCAGWNDNAEIYGQLYSAVGSMSLDLIRNLEVIYTNSELIGSLKLENPYDLVYDGKWTLDKMLGMSNAALSDLNGDGEYKITDDRFGYVSDLQAARALLYSAGMKVATRVADDSYELNFMNERFVDRYKKVYDIINNETSCYYMPTGQVDLGTGDDLNGFFKAGNILFLGAGLFDTDNLRDMTTDFGIIPTPKLDEEQENYVCYNFGTYYAAILKTAKNPEMSAVMLEALNAESYKSVVGTYFDTALKGKYSRDEETARMLDLILDSTYFDFAFVNQSSLGSVGGFFFRQIQAGKENITAAYESERANFEAKLETLLETYRNAAKTE